PTNPIRMPRSVAVEPRHHRRAGARRQAPAAAPHATFLASFRGPSPDSIRGRQPGTYEHGSWQARTDAGAKTAAVVFLGSGFAPLARPGMPELVFITGEIPRKHAMRGWMSGKRVLDYALSKALSR